MKVLVAQQVEGRWQKCGVVRVTRDGRLSLPATMQGQLSAVVARSAARQFAAESAARGIEVELMGRKFRADQF